MTGRHRLHIAVLLLSGLSGCTWHSQPLPMPQSRPTGGTGTLRASFARIDITPPPGIGLGGTGPEDRASTGYRTRLYASAMVLEDASGERVALVVADLPHVPANIHRLVADLVATTTGIGADRLIISATHTHSSLSAFYGERQYNTNVSRVTGYDPRIADHLVRSIAQAVETAAGTLRPAQLSWGEIAVVGASSNRSFAAFCLNPGYRQSAICKSWIPAPRQVLDTMLPHGVDTMLFMLRVDEKTGSTHRPLGTYSVFAIHGTAVPSLNTLYDGDVHVRVVEGLGRYIRSASGAETVNILANGTEGDAQPNVIRDPSCHTPRLGRSDPVFIPLGPNEEVDFVEPTRATVSHCVDTALDRLRAPVALITDSASRLFDRLGTGMSDNVPIRRAFATVWLPGNDGLCPEPLAGSSTAAGAEGMESRVEGWDWILFPLVRLAAIEGGPSVRFRPGECQSPKHTLLGLLQGPLIVGEHGLPETAQLTVVRIGTALLASVPAEVTTVAGREMDSAMIRSARNWTPSHVAIIGLANGFLQYVTTHAEYQWQAYEGGSDLYGPNTGAFVARRLGELVEEIAGPANVPSPPADVGPMTAYPGPPKSIMASPTAGPDSVRDTSVTLACEGGRLTGHWLDLAPGRLFPRQGALLELWDETTHTRIAQDGDGQLEVHLSDNKKDRGYEWRTVWLGTPAGHSYRLVRVESAGGIRRTSIAVVCQ